MSICEKLIPDGTRWTKDCGEFKKGGLYKAQRAIDGPHSVTIHNPGASNAETYVRATFNQNMKSARVHYYVDDREAWQMLREDEMGWHAGDGSRAGGGNRTSLGIEVCMGKGVADPDAAERNGAKLAAMLLARHGLGAGDIVPHRHWTGKNCPIQILPHWERFAAMVAEEYRAIVGEGSGENRGETPGDGSGDSGKNGGETPGEAPPTLKRGSRGNAVKTLQAALLAHGFDPGPQDGIFGPRTLAAVRGFQAAQGIVVDGVVGPVTWGRLGG